MPDPLVSAVEGDYISRGSPPVYVYDICPNTGRSTVFLLFLNVFSTFFSMKRSLKIFPVFFVAIACNVCVLSLGWASEVPDQILTLPVTRDVSLSSADGERSGNTGGSGRLKLKSIMECVLFDIDPSSLTGLLIADAYLLFKSASPESAPVKRAGVSTLASEWSEGASRGFIPEPGASCFEQAEFGKTDWAYPGSTLMDVVFGRGHTIWCSDDSTGPDRNGWQKLKVCPDIVAARVAGISKGFCLYDDVGSEWEEKNGAFEYRYFPNRLIHSRESRNNSPRLEIYIKGRDSAPPDPVSSIRIETKGLPSGEAFLFWKTPDDKGGGTTIGFDVDWSDGRRSEAFPRYLVPMAGKLGREVMMHIQDMNFTAGKTMIVSVTGIDSAGNRSSPFSREITVSKGFGDIKLDTPALTKFSGDIGMLPNGETRIRVMDMLDKYIPETGDMIPDHPEGYMKKNPVYSAKKKLIRLHGARNEDVCFQFMIREENGGDSSIDCVFEAHPEIKPAVYEFRYVPVKQSWFSEVLMPDPLVPIGEMDRGRSVKGWKTYLCELYIPHGVTAGHKKGKLVIDTGKDRLEVDIRLTVWDFALPDRLSFLPEMNAYAKVSPYKGYACYRLAHRHRTCLNRLPYGWDGIPEFAPIKTEKGFDFSEWDWKVGPLLDGSAFSDLPRKGQPVDVLYLPFSENWPVQLAGNYTKSWQPEKALSSRYEADLKKSFREFVVHLRRKGWTQTQFQFYLNNKVYYRKKFKRSSAPWIFDEPVNIQDFSALKWYGRLWHNAVDPVKGNSDPAFRCDVSYTQFGRDMLWGICDIEYLGGNTAQKTRMKHDEFILHKKAQFSEYGTANRISDSNLQPVLWQISAWAKGASGVLPWQTIGSEQCWEKAEQTALFYPREGKVYPSIRLKAFRYGQQMVEYFEKLADALDIPKDAVRKFVTDRLGVTGRVARETSTDAGTLRFDGVEIEDLWKLRLEIGHTLHVRLGKQNK